MTKIATRNEGENVQRRVEDATRHIQEGATVQVVVVSIARDVGMDNANWGRGQEHVKNL